MKNKKDDGDNAGKIQIEEKDLNNIIKAIKKINPDFKGDEEKKIFSDNLEKINIKIDEFINNNQQLTSEVINLRARIKNIEEQKEKEINSLQKKYDFSLKTNENFKKQFEDYINSLNEEKIKEIKKKNDEIDEINNKLLNKKGKNKKLK